MEKRIFGYDAQSFARLFDRFPDALPVQRGIAGRGHINGDPAPAGDQMEGETTLLHGTGLTHGTPVEAHEARLLAVEAQEQHLVRLQQGFGEIGQLIKISLHGAHDAPL